MIIDAQLLLSDDQALTTTAKSTNTLDMGANHALVPDKTERGEINLNVQVTAALAAGTSVQVQVRESVNSDMSSPDVLIETAAILTATLVAGYTFRLPNLPIISKRYVDVNYVIVGVFNAGTVHASLTLGKQINAMV